MNKIETIRTKISLTWEGCFNYFKNKRTQKEFLRYYENNPTDDEEIIEAINYIKAYGITVFPYQFSHKYNPKDVQLNTDASNGLHYVMRNNKKLYLRRDITYKTARNMYNVLLIEQDIESPHRYLTDDFNIKDNDVLVDIGSAEAFLALDVVEKVKKIYLFECEEKWIEALEYTFAPWKEKVEIIKKYVSDKTEGVFITIDDFFQNKDEKPTFIKIDIEGAEIQALNGMRQLLKTEHSIKLAICTYHKSDDYKRITDYFSRIGMSYCTSKKYMIFDNQKPYFRRGLIRVNPC